MPFPTVIVPPFPNVPFAAGVPPVLRSAAGAIDTLAAALTGSIDPATGGFTGRIDGLLSQATGRVAALSGVVQGVADGSNNIAAVFSSLGVRGDVVGQITGLVDRVTGTINGGLSGVVSMLSGEVTPTAADGPAVTAQVDPFQWGIFTTGGAPVVVGDSVAALEYNREFRLSTYPVEGGSFESYNKVEVPYDVRVTFTKGGTKADRSTFLAQVESAVASLDTYDVATPERVYTGVNAMRSSLRRTADRGATLLTVEVSLQYVRKTATAAFTNTKTPAGAADANTGAVQAVPPTPAQAAAAAAVESSLAALVERDGA
jgi:hypothetical protein